MTCAAASSSRNASMSASPGDILTYETTTCHLKCFCWKGRIDCHVMGSPMDPRPLSKDDCSFVGIDIGHCIGIDSMHAEATAHARTAKDWRTSRRVSFMKQEIVKRATANPAARHDAPSIVVPAPEGAPQTLVYQRDRDHEGHGVSLRPIAEEAYQATWRSEYTSTRLSRSLVQLMVSFDRLLSDEKRCTACEHMQHAHATCTCHGHGHEHAHAACTCALIAHLVSHRHFLCFISRIRRHLGRRRCDCWRRTHVRRPRHWFAASRAARGEPRRQRCGRRSVRAARTNCAHRRLGELPGQVTRGRVLV